jgi:hypothetical protein
MSEWYRSKDLFKDCLQDQYDSGVWAARLTSVQQSKRRTLVAPLKVEIYVSKTISGFPKRASRRKAMKIALFFVFLLVLHVTQSTPAYGQAWTGVLSPSRAIDWSHAGVPGGIPSASWTQCGSTIAAYGTSNSPASPATIQTAIGNCTPGGNGNNTYLQLGAGTFYLSGSFYLKGIQNFEVRGMGANQTLIYFYGNTGVGGDNCGGYYGTVCIESADVNYPGSAANGPVAWTAGYSRGTTAITLASVPNLKVGNPIILMQETTAMDVGAILETDLITSGHALEAPGYSGPYSAQTSGPVWTGYDQAHVYTVAGCNGSTAVGASCSGTNVAVTINPGLEEPNWTSSLAPEAYWSGSPSRNVGIQNFLIDGTNNGCSTGNGYGVFIQNSIYVWEQGVQDDNECRTHTSVQFVAHFTIRNNYIFLARDSTSTSYGFECFGSNEGLWENNITQAIASPWILSNSCGFNVVAYNYSINDYYSVAGFGLSMLGPHAPNDDFILWEGNIGSEFDGDITHGSHNFNTLFRNYFSGTNTVCWQSGPGGNTYAAYTGSTFGTCTNGLSAAESLANNRFFNIIGNVLGSPSATPGYQNVATTGDASGYVYNIGNGNNSQGAVVPPDSTVSQTLYRWGNCDNTNGGNGGTAFTSCQFNSSDVPVTANLAASQQAFAQTVPSSHALPASFYYTSTPSWWPSAKPWPIIGPDVADGNIPGVNGLVFTNPADDCYRSLTGSTLNGTGGPFTFNASVCYGLSGPLAPPSPPSNLSATVN